LRRAPAKQAAHTTRSDASGIAVPPALQRFNPSTLQRFNVVPARHIGATQNPTSRCQASFDYVKDHRRTRITHRRSLSNYLLTIYVIKKHLKAIILHKFVFGKRRRLEILVEPCQ
jgi:hypothetical protein